MSPSFIVRPKALSLSLSTLTSEIERERGVAERAEREGSCRERERDSHLIGESSVHRVFACMEEEVKKKGPIPLDWGKLLDDEPPPVLVVATTISDTDTARSPPPPTGGDGDEEEQSHRDELMQLKDSELEEKIGSIMRTFETVRHNLKDGGAKLMATRKRMEAEIERRRLLRLEKVNDGCEKLNPSNGPCSSSASDGLRQEAPPSIPELKSVFASKFFTKLETNQTDSRTVDAFEGELSYFQGCARQKKKNNGKFSPKERRRTASSSKQSPFKCPTNLSIDVDKHIHTNGDQNFGHCSTPSPRQFEENSRKRKASQVLSSINLRPRNGKTVVLVDEEEPELMEWMEEADKVEDWMKDSKIYYPSRDDPESMEICYSDMGCLAPEAYLESTIMNFYIRYLKQTTSPTDGARGGYHFFNTYFYDKLKKHNDGENLFIKFRRWWKGVNIFHKAYIFLPINENRHWSLVIICIPDREDESGLFLLHLDSLGLHFSKPIFENVKSFLREEWNYLNKGEAPPDLPTGRMWKNLTRRIEEKTIAVPQQRNEYDCGLFVLFFIERFIGEAPQRLRRKDLAMFGNKWFKPEEASSLRRKIKKLLVEEFRNERKDNCASDDDPLSSVGPRGLRHVQSINC